MVDVEALAAAVKTALATVAGISVYDGFVPSTVPMAGGYILPYVVIWAGVGGNPGELPACGEHSTDTLIWDFQTTVVASNAAACRAVAQAAKQALTNLRTGTGRVRPHPDAFNQQAPILDTSVTPARLMLPLQWQLTTN